MPINLDEIKARLAAASPGPWRWVRAYECHGKHWCLENDHSAALGSTINHNLVTLSTAKHKYDDAGHESSVGDSPDFQLIAHAPADIAALLAEVEQLRTTFILMQDGGMELPSSMFDEIESWRNENRQ